jgi:hypothetical protein
MNEVVAKISVGRTGIAIVVCFALGWLAGGVDAKVWHSTRALLADTYVKKFNAMSGANVEEYLYYVISDDAASLQQFTTDVSGIRRIDATDFPTVFHAYIEAASKREMLSHLREAPFVSAVFTVPFMCH